MNDPSASPFAIRGVIEGYYGEPWTHAQRLDLVEFMARHGFNTFAYAPKDDPLLRHDWRLPYTGLELERLSELVDRCRSHGMQLVYCLSPGLSMGYASDDDFSALVAKFESVAGLGVRWFGLLLDDIPPTLQQPDDRAAFGSLVEAQVALIGRLFSGFGPERSLIVCPTQYHGTADEHYITRMGKGIDPRIDLFWTGREVCSATLELEDAQTFARSTGRPPTYWDNYPVNDGEMRHELHIGPYRGRDPQLWRASRGVIANGMELYQSSKIALVTIADYLASPETYEPEASWRMALREVVGETDMEAFAVFADNVRTSALSADEAPRLRAALMRLKAGWREGVTRAPAEELAALADEFVAAAERLLRQPVQNRALMAEAKPWLETFDLGARALRHAADLALADRVLSRSGAELLPYLERLRASDVRVFGNVLEGWLADLTSA